MNWNGMLRVGASPIPGYELQRLCGRGAFAEVWHAVGPKGEIVALKIIKITDATEAVREIRAIQSISKISHRRLIRIDQVWSPPGHIVLAMELADGSLLDVLEAYKQECRTAVPIEHLLVFMKHAAEAIDYLNTRQHQLDRQRVSFQHCDIKPNNLLLVDGRVKLADFGLATPLTTASGNRPRCGTPAYCGPEIFQGILSDRTDQYALALTYYHLRTGELPFDRPARDFKPSSFVSPTLTLLPAHERVVIERGLRPVPMDRWLNCMAMVHVLEKALCPPTDQEESLTQTSHYRPAGLSDTIHD